MMNAAITTPTPAAQLRPPLGLRLSSCRPGDPRERQHGGGRAQEGPDEVRVPEALGQSLGDGRAAADQMRRALRRKRDQHGDPEPAADLARSVDKPRGEPRLALLGALRRGDGTIDMPIPAAVSSPGITTYTIAEPPPAIFVKEREAGVQR
jgi:hypothetical protein